MSLIDAHPLVFGLTLFGLAYMNSLLSTPRDGRDDEDHRPIRESGNRRAVPDPISSGRRL